MEFWTADNIFLWAIVLSLAVFTVFGLRYLAKKTGINTDDLQEVSSGIAKKSASEITTRSSEAINKKVDNFSNQSNDSKLKPKRIVKPKPRKTDENSD